MAYSNLWMRMARPDGGTNLPVLLVMHGWDGQGNWSVEYMQRLAAYGFFVVSPGMRGRMAASGARDAGGREIHDIYDALLYVRANYAAYVSPTKAALVGFSGGGGNAFAAACKFPDTFQAVVPFYGMSDYGRDGTDGWYFNNNNPPYETDMEAAIGGTPVAVPNNYYARDTTAAIANYSGGQLVVFHDEGDSTVPVIHSQRIITAMDGAGLTNYSTQYTGALDDPRWAHGLGENSAEMIAAEAIYTPLVLAAPVWTVPASGTHTVIGYLVTKRYSCWLNEGLDAVATVAYGTTPNQYTVTPLAGTPNVTITQADGKTGSALAIGGVTVITVS